MRLLLLLAGISVLGASCSTVKKASAPAANQQRKTTSATASPVFIENISFTPGQENSKPASFGSAQDKSFNSKEPADQVLNPLPALGSNMPFYWTRQ
jgi:hypothetical protein